VSFHNATERPQTGFCRVKLEIPPWISVREKLLNASSADVSASFARTEGMELPNTNRIVDLGEVDLRVLPDEWIQLLPAHSLLYWLGNIPGGPSETQNVLHLHIYMELGRKEFPIEFTPPKPQDVEDAAPST
jgi:hypothetical protein